MVMSVCCDVMNCEEYRPTDAWQTARLLGRISTENSVGATIARIMISANIYHLSSIRAAHNFK